MKLHVIENERVEELHFINACVWNEFFWRLQERLLWFQLQLCKKRIKAPFPFKLQKMVVILMRSAKDLNVYCESERSAVLEKNEQKTKSCKNMPTWGKDKIYTLIFSKIFRCNTLIKFSVCTNDKIIRGIQFSPLSNKKTLHPTTKGPTFITLCTGKRWVH